MKVKPLMKRVVIVPRLLSFYEYGDLAELFKKHFSGDWGRTGTYETTHLTPLEVGSGFPTRADSDHDAKLNKLVCDGIAKGRVCSSYIHGDTVIWIHTESWGEPHENTCMMEPDDY